MKIPLNEFNGPFNLLHTLKSEQCPADLWRLKESPHTYRKIGGKWIKATITQSNSHLNVDPSPTLTFSEKIQLRKDILALFWADYPLEDFYNVYSCDPYFKKIFSALNGLRVMKPGNISWSLIEAICSQNTTVEQVRKRNRLFRTHYGQKVLFEDDDVFYTFPNLSTIAKLTEEELREYCNVGYRAKYILNAARAFTERELMSLKQMSSKTARRRLMQIKGIGPKVADVFLLYGLGMPDVFPMDVHLKRGLKREYFHGRKVSKKTLRNFALEKFGTHAGFAHLHMFYWERHQEISG